MKDWRIKYKKDFLEELANKKRIQRGQLDYVQPETINHLVRVRMKRTGKDELTVLNSLIQDVRENKLAL